LRPINPKKSRVFSFLLGLIYGYRTADFSLKSLPMKEFDPANRPSGDVYYLNKKEDIISKNEPIENPTHVVIINEDLESKKVRIYIYKA
jgi:hypothetical protein